MQALIVMPVEMDDAILLALYFSAQHAVLELVDDFAHFGEIGHCLGTVIGEDIPEALGRRFALTGLRIGRVVAKEQVFGEYGARIDTETIDTAPHPEAQYIGHGCPNFGVAPVQIGLLPQERVIIVLPTLLVPLPGTTAETALPVIG